MSITIGDAILWLRAKSDKLKDDLGQAENQVKGFGQQVGSSLKESMNVAIGQIMSQGMQDLANGIQNLASDLTTIGQEYAQQVENFSRLTGANAEDASRIIQTADDMRVSYDDLTTAMRTYAMRQGEAGGATQLSVEQLAALSDQYLALAPGVARTNFLMENFGKAGLAMGKLMEQGGDAIRDMAAGVSDSLIMTAEGIQAAREYEMAMDDWNDSLDGIKLELAQALLPVLKDFAVIAKDYLIPALKWLVDLFMSMPAPVRGIVVALGALLVGLVQIGPALMGISGIVSMFGAGGALAGVGAFITGTLVPGIVSVGTAIIGFLLSPIGLLIAAIGLLIYVIYEFGADAWKTLTMIGTLIGAIVKRVGFELGQAFTRAGTFLADFGKSFLEMLERGAEAIGQFISDVVRGLGDIWTQITTSISDAFRQAVTAVQNWLSSLWNTITTTARTWATNLKNSFLNVGRSIVDGIWQGIQNGWNWLKDMIEDNIESLLDWVKDLLGIESPSKRFALEVGGPSAEGIGEGFQAKINATAARMGQAAANLPAAVQQVMTNSSRNNTSIGHIEYHGAFSSDELAYLEGRNMRHAERMLVEALG